MSNKYSIIKCPNCSNLNYDLCIVCQFCGLRFEKTKEDFERVINKYFHKDWKNSYIGLIWKNMKDNQVFYLDKNYGILKYHDTYRIIERKNYNE